MPENFAAFQELYTSLRLEKSTPTSTEAIHHKKLMTLDLSYLEEECDVYLTHTTHVQPGLPALERKLKNWMEKRQLPVYPDCIDAVLGVLAILKNLTENLSEAMVELDGLVQTCRVDHVFVVPGLSGGWQGKLSRSGFVFQPLNGQKLAYRCQKLKSKVFEGFARELDGWPSISSPKFERRAMHINKLFWKLREIRAVQDFGLPIAEGYLQGAAVVQVNEMWASLEDAFLFPNALGLRFFEFSKIRFLPSAEVWSFCEFEAKATETWVGKQILVRQIRVPRFDSAQRALDEFDQEYNVEELSHSPHFPYLELVCRTLLKSRNHLTDGRIEESFLFLVIAIEQLFSEKSRTTQTVASRMALVCHIELGLSFRDAKSQAERLYDLRSRFVHEGQSVPVDALQRAIEFCETIVRYVVRLCRQSTGPSETPHSRWRWLKRIDYLIAKYEADLDVSDEDLFQFGITPRLSKTTNNCNFHEDISLD